MHPAESFNAQIAACPSDFVFEALLGVEGHPGFLGELVWVSLSQFEIPLEGDFGGLDGPLHYFGRVLLREVEFHEVSSIME